MLCGLMQVSQCAVRNLDNVQNVKKMQGEGGP